MIWALMTNKGELVNTYEDHGECIQAQIDSPDGYWVDTLEEEDLEEVPDYPDALFQL